MYILYTWTSESPDCKTWYFFFWTRPKALQTHVPYVLSLQILSIPPFSSFNPSPTMFSLPPVNKIPWLMPVNWMGTHHTLQHSQHLLWIRNVNPPPPPSSLSLGYPLSSNVCSPPPKRESKSPSPPFPTNANLDNQCRLYRRRRRLLSRRISSMMKRASMSTEYSIVPLLSSPLGLSLSVHAGFPFVGLTTVPLPNCFGAVFASFCQSKFVLWMLY